MRITIFFLLVFIKKYLCDESNESKYIDLLPEEEKEQFLQKIARRIFEEAEVTDDRYKQSTEITDDQLNQQTDFVEKILREESANLRKQNRDEKEREEKSDESMKVKPLEKDKIFEERVDDERGYVDLTLRHGSRKKRTDNFNDDVEQNTEGRIDVDIKYDTEENKVIENGEKNRKLDNAQRQKDSEESVNKKEQSSFEDIQVKYYQRNRDDENNTSDNNLKDTVSTTDKPRITQMTDFDNESAEKVFKEFITTKETHEDVKPTTTESIVSEKIETSSRRFTQSIYEAITNDEDLESTTQVHTTKTTTEVIAGNKTLTDSSTDTPQVNDTKRNLRSDDQENTTVQSVSGGMYISKEHVEESVSDYENTTQQIQQIDKNNTIQSLIASVTVNTDTLPEIEDQLKEITSIITMADENIHHSTESSKNISYPEITTIKHATTNISEGEKNDSNVHALNPEFNENKFETTTTTSEGVKSGIVMNEVANDVVKALRQRLLKDSEESGSAESTTTAAKKNNPTNKQSYSVYELPSNQEPFVLKHKSSKYKNQDQPHYVPIYNYSPNNAYFNAQNRYGPDLDEKVEESDSDKDYHETLKERDIYLSNENFGALRDGEDNRKFKLGFKYGPKRAHDVPQKMMTVVNQNPHFSEALINPDDYSDTYYYYGRTNNHLRSRKPDKSKELSDSYEETHPSTDTIKDRIRSVREILFQKQIFGYIQPINDSIGDMTPPPKPPTTTESIIFDVTKAVEHFGRMKADDENENSDKMIRVGYVKYDNFRQDLVLTKAMPEEMMKKVNVIKSGNHLFFKDDANKKNKKQLNTLRNKTNIYSNDDSSDLYDSISKVLLITNEVDLFPTLKKLRGMNMSYYSRSRCNALSAYEEALGDILEEDNKPFIQYDWLGTTVDIQSALVKLIDMTEAVEDGIIIHPADLELLKYVAYLFQTAETVIFLDENETNLSRMGVMLPRNRKRKKMFLKEKGLLNRVWLFKRDNIIENKEFLKEFKTFLYYLQTVLFDLHNAIKHIALVTKYNNQAWFQHLQRIYMTKDKQHFLEVTLHLTAARVFGLIEESAKKGVEFDMVDYIRNNEKEVERTANEFIFVLRLLDEIKCLED